MIEEHIGLAIDTHLERCAFALERIAVALEALASNATKSAEQGLDLSYSEYWHLESMLRSKRESFQRADAAATQANVKGRRWTDADRDWHRRSEEALEDAQAAFDAFKAAHPDIAAKASQVAR